MNVVRFDTKALVELFEIFFLLFLITTARVIIAIFGSLNWSLLTLRSIDEVKFINLTGSE